MLARDVLDDVLVHHHRIGSLDQSVETIIDFRLTGRGHFVMLPLNFYAELFHDQAHLRADILLLIQRGDREVTFFVADLVTQVGHFLPAGVPDRFLGIDAVESAVALGIKLHVVEDEELRLGSEYGAIGDAGAI